MFVFQFVIKPKKEVLAGSLEEFYNAKSRHPQLVKNLHQMKITEDEMHTLEKAFKQMRENDISLENSIDWINQTITDDKNFFDHVLSAFTTPKIEDCPLRKFRLNTKEIIVLFEINQYLGEGEWGKKSQEYKNACKEHAQLNYIFESIKQATQKIRGMNYYEAYPYGNHAIFFEMAQDYKIQVKTIRRVEKILLQAR